MKFTYSSTMKGWEEHRRCWLHYYNKFFVKVFHDGTMHKAYLQYCVTTGEVRLSCTAFDVKFDHSAVASVSPEDFELTVEGVEFNVRLHND